MALSEPFAGIDDAAVAVAVRCPAHKVLHQEVGQAAAELRTSVVRRQAVPWPVGASPVVLRQAVPWPVEASPVVLRQAVQRPKLHRWA